MQVGTTKDKGLYNKPLAAAHPGALAAGNLPQYNTMVRGSMFYHVLEDDSCHTGMTAWKSLSASNFKPGV